jgi:hypothetical protein
MTSFAAERGRRTTHVDRWLGGLLGAEADVALVAVGGYGRREMLPRSDLDVLLLHAGRDDIAGIADRIWYPVWDSGAELDHAVRTVPQARRVAQADLKVALGLLSARHVAGDPDLTERLRAGALEDWRAAAPARLAELHAAHDERARTSGELAFLLEPDLKEARGGPAGRARDPGGGGGLGGARARSPGPYRVRADPRHPARAARDHRAAPGPAGARGAGRSGHGARAARRGRAAPDAGRRGPGPSPTRSTTPSASPTG